MTAATTSAWLTAEAAWLLQVDAAASSPSSGLLGLIAAATALNDAKAALTADWNAAHPAPTGAPPVLLPGAGPQAVTNAVSAISATFNALYSGGTPGGTSGTGTPLRLQQDAATMNAIASRIVLGTVTAADVTWLQSEENFFNNLDTVLNNIDPSIGLQTAYLALTSSGMQDAANAASAAGTDSTGAQAVTAAITSMTNVWNTIYSRGVGSGPANDALSLQITYVPDIQSMIAAATPPAPTGTPPSGPLPIPTMAALTALAHAVVADTTICAGTPNANVGRFMTAYLTWVGSGLSTSVAPVTYTQPVVAAINRILGANAAPTCSGLTVVPPPSVPATTTGTSIATVLVGVAAVGAVGYLAWYVYTHRRPTPVQHHPRLNPQPNPRRRVKRRMR